MLTCTYSCLTNTSVRYLNISSFQSLRIVSLTRLLVSTVHPHIFSTEGLDLAWTCYDPPSDKLVPLANALEQVAQFEYQSMEHGNRKVPRWLLRFALRFLSQDPLPPTSVVINCLTIIATDLGCNLSDISSMASDEKCVHNPKTTVSLLTLHQPTA